MKFADAIDVAVDQANKAIGTFRHGCVIMNGRKVVAVGNNHRRKHIGTFSVHAEMDAIWKMPCNESFDNLKAIVIRINREGHLVYSKPCEMCQKTLQDNGIRCVAYSTHNGHVVVEKI
jgi:deoxycytidylate deaminase